MSLDPATGSSRRPLLLTEDAELLESLLRLVAAAGAEPTVLQSPTAARTTWASAPLVLVGDDLAAAVARSRLPRRSGVVLVGRDLDDAGVWRRAVDLGAEHVVLLPDGEAWLVDRCAEAGEGGTRGTLVAVVGGRGGAGATVTATALAVTGLRLGHRTMLVDGDPLGGGIDLVLGGEASTGLRWPELTGARGRLAPGSLHEALPRVDELTVLSWGRTDGLDVPGEAMASLLDAGLRGSDLVIVDLPRQPVDASRVALAAANVTLLVVPAELRATAAAARVLAVVREHADDVRVLVRGPAPAGLSAEDVAEALGVPLAGLVRAEPGLAAALERGDPPGRRTKGPLAGFCAGFLDTVLSPEGRGVACPGPATPRAHLRRPSSPARCASGWRGAAHCSTVPPSPRRSVRRRRSRGTPTCSSGSTRSSPSWSGSGRSSRSPTTRT
jgi:secretion/DNA translocation related CpaE-like protein